MNKPMMDIRDEALFRRFRAKVETLRGDGEPSVLVALSGGADSSALALLFAGLARFSDWRVHALHVNHGIRGAEAARDEEAAKRLCERLGIPFHVKRLNVPQEAKRRKESVETCARTLRYEALEEERKAFALTFIATAHTANDQLETMLFRIGRGTSLSGLCGIPERRGAILRPLLFAEKKDLEELLLRAGIPYATDSTNLQPCCSRNVIRLQALPPLLSVCPDAPAAVQRLAEDLSEDEAFLQSLLPAADAPLQEVRALPNPLLRRWLAHQAQRASDGTGQLGKTHILALQRLTAAGKTGDRLDLPGNATAILCADRLRFFNKKRESATVAPPAQTLGREKLPVFGGKRWICLMDVRRFSEFCAENEKIHRLFTNVAVNSAKIKGELILRERRAKDTIVFGGHTRQLSKLAAARCPDPLDRKRYPVVCDDEGVVWTPGYPLKDGYKSESDEQTVWIVMGEDQNERN